MKFKVDRAALAAALGAANAAIKTKPTMPVLSNVRITAGNADGGFIRAEGTDLDITVTAYVKPISVNLGDFERATLDVLGGDPAATEAEGITASALVDSKRLYDVVRSLSGATVDANFGDDKVVIRGGGASFTLPTLDANEYPDLPDTTGDAVVVDGEKLATLIGMALPSVSDDGSRPNLMGIYMVPKGNGFKIASTDGHRLTQVSADVSETALDEARGPLRPDLAGKGFIVPERGALEIKRLMESTDEAPQIRLSDNGVMLIVRTTNTTVCVRLVDAAFPDYRQVIPKTSERTLKIPRLPLLGALRRMQIMASQSRTNGVYMDIRPTDITLKADGFETGDAAETIEGIETIGATKEFKIAFNGRYLAEALGVLASERVRISLNEALSPLQIAPDDNTDYLGILMPMRI